MPVKDERHTGGGKGRPGSSEVGAEDEDTAKEGKGARNRNKRRGQRGTPDISSAVENRTPNGQRATQLAEEYESDFATARSVRSRNQGRLEKPRETRQDKSSRLRKDKYRKKDLTGDNKAGSNPYDGEEPVKPTQIGLEKAQVNSILVLTSCNGNERWRDEAGNGEKSDIGVSSAIPPRTTSLSKSAKAKRKGSKGRESSSSNKRFIEHRRCPESSDQESEKTANEDRRKGRVATPETELLTNLEAQYKRPRSNRRDSNASSRMVDSQGHYIDGYQTWVELTMRDGSDGKQTRRIRSRHPTWEEDRLIEQWRNGTSQSESDVETSQEGRGVESGNRRTNGQKYDEVVTRAQVAEVMAASEETVQGKKVGGKKNHRTERCRGSAPQSESDGEISPKGNGAPKDGQSTKKQKYEEAVTRTQVVEVNVASAENVKERKEATVKKEGITWNLRGRPLDDILTDLEILKNDPELPMPVIEADPASIEDFEQYVKGLPILEGGEAVGDEEEERQKDKESLTDLKRRSGHCHNELRPDAFPEELWPYVINDQKLLVSQRWVGYDPGTIREDVAHLLNELKVSPERVYAQPYFQAQALANIDRLVVKGKDKITPMIHSKYTHKMELIPGTRPRKELPQRFSETQNAFLKAKLAILEKEGRIVQKEGLDRSDWLHRLVIVENGPKMAAFRLKHGNDVQQALNDPANSYEISQLCRLTIDCREINKCLVVEPYPMPDLNIGKENIIGSRYLSTSDAADAFYTVPIREEDYGKTTVAALGKQWAFKVMLQGGINSARHYARVISETFDGVPRSKILPYQDDALVHAKDLSTAIDNQQLLYDCIRPNSIMLKPSKTRIGYSSTKFLGDIYTSDGRLPDPSRVESILRMEGRPKTLKQVRHIVGLLVWNIEFIPNGMGILSYLTDLMRKDVDIATEWREEVHGKAILQLKAALASPPCLKPIDVSRPFRVHVDACKNGRGIGAVLLQEHLGQWRPCSYFSRALTPAQRQWSATELEAHALVCAARHWERYLQNGHKWTAIVDHKALIYLVVKRTKTNNTRLLNSVMYLQGHYFDIIHRNGDEHFDADAVSRILQSGDIEEALEAADMEEPDDKEVTMRDLKNLNTLLQLRLGQYVSEKLPGPIGSAKRDSAPIIAQVNMARPRGESQERADRRSSWNRARDRGFQEAQEKARLAQSQIDQERMEKILHDPAEEAIVDEEVQPAVPQPPDDNHEGSDDDKSYTEEGFGLEDNIDDRYKGVQDDPQRILLQSGPHRWTPATKNEYVERYVPLEGKLWIHPRTKRLYQITNVFFYEKYKLAAAYSRVMDGGQPDPTDQYPHRIAGTMGLEELVKEFEDSGGSQGSSKTKWPRTEQEWAREQELDPTLGPILLDLRAKRDELVAQLPNPLPTATDEEKRQWEQEVSAIVTETTSRGRTIVYDGVLQVKPLDDRHPNWQYLVPDSLKRNVIELYHDSMGHPGAERTAETIKLAYWWYGISVDVENHVRRCKACARRKAYNNCAAVPIQEYDSPTMPWQRAHIDITGKLITSTKGNKYVLVIKDALTRFVETAPLRSKTAEEVAKAFIHLIIYRHGSVRQLVSDNGGEFDNALWAQVTQLLQIDHTTTSPYNPRANGLAENHMRTLKDAIGIYCDESQKDWDEHLEGTTMSYNTTVNSQTGYTPYYMMYGREARLPSESWLRHFSKVKDIRPYVQQLVLGLVRVWDETSARKHDQVVVMQKGQRPIRHLKYYDFREGDYAMVCVIPKTKMMGWTDTQYRQLNLKLQPRYAGPYLILRKISPVVYVLEVDGAEKTFHSVNMKPYQGKIDALTPFVEPGYERMEAGLKKPLETPLLMSPDADLNEKAASLYKKKKLTAKQQTTKAVNAARSKTEREDQAKRRLSHSQSEDVWIMVDTEDQESEDDDHDDSEETQDEEHSGSAVGTTQESWPIGEVKMTMMHGTKSIAHIIEDIESGKVSKDCSPPDSEGRRQILEASTIKYDHHTPEDTSRIDKWIQEISMMEQSRKSKLTETDQRLEQEMATDYEYIGWTLREYQRQWDCDHPETWIDSVEGEVQQC